MAQALMSKIPLVPPLAAPGRRRSNGGSCRRQSFSWRSLWQCLLVSPFVAVVTLRRSPVAAPLPPITLKVRQATQRKCHRSCIIPLYELSLSYFYLRSFDLAAPTAIAVNDGGTLVATPLMEGKKDGVEEVVVNENIGYISCNDLKEDLRNAAKYYISSYIAAEADLLSNTM